MTTPQPLLIGELKYQEGANGIFQLSYAQRETDQVSTLINAGKLTIFADKPVNNTYFIETSADCRNNPDCLAAVKIPNNLLPILTDFVGKVIVSNVIVNTNNRYIMGTFQIDSHS